MERDVQVLTLTAYTEISTHTLTWSVTVKIKSAERGNKNFNSHAHVERDGVFAIFVKFFTNFNSHAHVERDTQFSKKW